LVALLPECKRQFTEPPLYAIRVDVRKVLTVYTRCVTRVTACTLALSPYIVTR
jgi:hypothetical protein